MSRHRLSSSDLINQQEVISKLLIQMRMVCHEERCSVRMWYPGVILAQWLLCATLLLACLLFWISRKGRGMNKV